MAATDTTPDIDELKHDIHGERVADEHQCDYCGAVVEIDGPVQYEVLRLTDMQSIEQLPDVPSGWVPDALRCAACERAELEPTTDGVDEVLIEVRLANSADVLSIDASSITVVDFSPGEEGYYPPLVDMQLLMRFRDLGLTRWMRIQHLLELDDGTGDVGEALRTCVKHSLEVPPSLSESGQI